MKRTLQIWGILDMSIIFIDFQKNLIDSRTNRNTQFSYSLNEQYEMLKTRIPIHKKRASTLSDFVEISFPTGIVKKYYFSSPNFKRESVVLNNGLKFLNNVVIKPELSVQMRQYLPDNTNLILIGDIQEGETQKTFIVKAIDFIDEFITGTNEIEVNNSYCVHTFSTASAGGKPYIRWTIDRPDHSKTIFTPDFIANLIKNCFPMSLSSAKKVVRTYENWTEYLTFRQRYLDQQSTSQFKLNQVEFLTAYSINRQTYLKNSLEFDDDLLVEHEDFKKGEQILLKNPTSEAEEISLIAVHIDYNLKKFLEESVEQKNGRKQNPNEKALRLFSRENVALAKESPSQENYGKVLGQSLSLNERYKLIYQDILPSVVDIEQKYEQIIASEQNKINEIFKSQTIKEVKERIDLERKSLEDKLQKDLLDFDEDFFKNLYSMVDQGTDKEIEKVYEYRLTQEKTRLEKDTKSRIEELHKTDQLNDKAEEILLKIFETKYANFQLENPKKNLYIEKHNKQKIDFEKSQNKKIEQLLADLEKKLNVQFTKRNDHQRLLECDKIKVECEEKLTSEKAKRIETDTIRRFSIYFKVEAEDPSKMAKNDYSVYTYLIYDNRAEKAKIDRQKTSLENFYEGNVKNPYLASYLFAPKELKKNYYDFTDWNWFLESLNDKQKEAVQKAVASRGIFLLQGPPGTGKTQVIAEIIGHLVQDGKKVLVASETHKAIDNVFDRLPLLADIRPIRLIPTRTNKSSNFGPENLVDNLYENIAKNMRKIIRSYEKFAEYREQFYENYQKQLILNDRIEKNKKLIRSIEDQIEQKAVEINQNRDKKHSLNDKISVLTSEVDKLYRTRRHLERGNLRLDDDLFAKVIEDFMLEANESIEKEDVFLRNDTSETIRSLLQIEIRTIYEETNAILSSASDMKVQQDIIRLKEELNSYKDELGDWIPNTEPLYKPIQIKLKELLTNKQSSFNLNDLKISKIVTNSALLEPLKIRGIIETYQEELFQIRNKYLVILDDKIKIHTDEIQKQKDNLDRLERDMNTISEEIRKLQENNDYQAIREDEARLRRTIAKFIEDFNVAIDYKDNSDALKKIKFAYDDLDKNFKEKEVSNKKIIPIYKKISDYLSLEEVKDADRVIYTKPLFEKVNLFGITNTSRDNFNERSMDGLEKYNLGSIDLRKQGIDVVIIDEVSKSSFLDLLIPILYGKTIILVGDHRQLPPMYEFRNLRVQDFMHIDENILTKGKNDIFKNLYEDSFFKGLFEEVPSDYKVMLNQQYRSHEHIMEVYNCFYNNQLQLGTKTQNNEKEHHLSVVSNSRQVISPNKHVYFVDCKKFESKETDSTSIYNSNEAEVVVKLLKLLNDNYKNHPNFKPEVNRDRDERMSIGVICTYGDQARVIKQKIKGSKLRFNMFNEKADSKLVISTVDDFQGDERDIIILSMVRNPQNRAKSDPGFVTAYQRINVALSRARRLLIVVGNKGYLEDKGVIDLPDVFGEGNDRKNFYVYREVIGAISRYGTILDDEDIL